VGRDYLESLNRGVQVAQNTIRNQRGLILRRMNLGMLDDRELVREIGHASTATAILHGCSTDGRGYNSVSINGQSFPPGLWKLAE
jgi:hypothetical protein